MSRSGLKLWGRVCVVALFWATGMTLGARTSEAAGCHVMERPILGLTHSWEYGAEAQLDRPAPTVAPIPCSGEVPGQLVRHVAPQVMTASPVVFLTRPSRITRIIPETERLRPHYMTDALDRPPRSSPFVVTL